MCAEPTRPGRGKWKEGVLGSGIAGVCVGFVGTLWIVWWLVVRGDFSAKISWEGSCRVDGESGGREAFSMGTVTRRGRRQGNEGRFGVHEKSQSELGKPRQVGIDTVAHYIGYFSSRTTTTLVLPYPSPSNTYTDHRRLGIHALSNIKRTRSLLYPAIEKVDEAILDHRIIQGPSPKEGALVPCANFVVVATKRSSHI